MLRTEILKPTPLNGTQEQQLATMHRYLLALADQLQSVFDSIEDASDLAPTVATNQQQIDNLRKKLATKASKA